MILVEVFSDKMGDVYGMGAQLGFGKKYLKNIKLSEFQILRV